MGMAGHAQAKKNRNFFKNLHRLKMVQFAKLTCLNSESSFKTLFKETKIYLMRGLSTPVRVPSSVKCRLTLPLPWQGVASSRLIE